MMPPVWSLEFASLCKVLASTASAGRLTGGGSVDQQSVTALAIQNCWYEFEDFLRKASCSPRSSAEGFVGL